VSVAGKEVLKGVNLSIKEGEIHASLSGWSWNKKAPDAEGGDEICKG